MLKRLMLCVITGAMLAAIFYNPLHKVWLCYTYRDYTPKQIVQAYHDAYFYGDTKTVCFLAHSGDTQFNIPELPDGGALLLMWTDSVVTFQTKTYVYSTFVYGTIFEFDEEYSTMYIHIREALYYEEGIWRVGLGSIISVDQIKNIDYINIEV